MLLCLRYNKYGFKTYFINEVSDLTRSWKKVKEAFRVFLLVIMICMHCTEFNESISDFLELNSIEQQKKEKEVPMTHENTMNLYNEALFNNNNNHSQSL